MPKTRYYLVPDYFPSFRCKIGACRHSCCEGWAISVTMKDYFKLLSVPCSEELRRRIDTALHLYDYPTESKYAQISPRYDGNCGMRLPDGRCGLHAELGEEAGVNWLFSDFKKREGYKRSLELCRELGIYRQNYCGCRLTELAEP